MFAYLTKGHFVLELEDPLDPWYIHYVLGQEAGDDASSHYTTPLNAWGTFKWMNKSEWRLTWHEVGIVSLSTKYCLRLIQKRWACWEINGCGHSFKHPSGALEILYCHRGDPIPNTCWCLSAFPLYTKLESPSMAVLGVLFPIIRPLDDLWEPLEFHGHGLCDPTYPLVKSRLDSYETMSFVFNV